MNDAIHDARVLNAAQRWPIGRADALTRETAVFSLGGELAAALKLHAIGVHYQPQFDVATGKGCGVEALARWALCSGRVIAPSIFITAAEQLGMIQDLGNLVLKSSCETARDWCRRGSLPPTLSVNVSVLQIDAAFSGVIERTLRQFGFPASQLELEITESALIANPERTIDYLKEWKRIGVRIAVDDFGTGYSSLSYLARLPVDRLKIDRSLVQRMALDSKGFAIMRLILRLADELELDVVAEGVETEEELRALSDLGCPKAQGYLLARPMPARQALVALAKPWGNRLKRIADPLQAHRGVPHAC